MSAMMTSDLFELGAEEIGMVGGGKQEDVYGHLIEFGVLGIAVAVLGVEVVVIGLAVVAAGTPSPAY